MSLLNFDGSVKYVWNPFSLQQLKTKLGSFDTYLECVASKNSGECTAPTDEIFRKQQIPMISVYQRCLSNYQEMTWDQGTHVLFNTTLQRTIKLDKLIPAVQDSHKVAAKLLEAKSNGFDNTAVLDMFLGGSQSADYFKYSNITSSNPGSALIDACLTFSGPAKITDLKISQPFTACLESYANRSGCDIPHMLWSGRSTNKVPVATQHTLSITDPSVRLKMANGEMEATQSNVLAVLDKLEKEWTGDGLKITIFSADGDLLHQYADCVMQGPMGSMTLTPGPDGVEKVVWSRSSDGSPSRLFELPCSGERLTNRDGISRDDAPPFTCGTRARRAVVKHFLRVTYGGEKENQGAKSAVIKEVLALINRTREAWAFKSNFMCTCPAGVTAPDGTTTGWGCCEVQKECATEPCPCPSGYSVKASVACCTSVCNGLAGVGIMEPFSKIKGEKLATDLLASVGAYMKNDIWTSTAPWLKFDPQGAESYQASWKSAEFEVSDAGLFDAANPVVYYDEITYPFKSSFWEHCAGLLQQVIWTMPIDRATGRPKMPTTSYDPVTGTSQTPNITYTEEFIQSLTIEAYKSSPLFWHYNVRHSPSQSEVCRRTIPRKPTTGETFTVGKNQAPLMGFSSMTLGGLGGADCYCGWWWSTTECRIPDSLCIALIQMLGFRRVCVDQNQIYVSQTDHRTVLDAISSLKARQPDLQYPCPSLQISEHWGLMNASTGAPFVNTTDAILREGISGFRVGNQDWLFSTQSTILNPYTRIDPLETHDSGASIECNTTSGSIVDHFIDDLFPSAQGVRQSMPQSYCTRYGIELARLTVYKATGLVSASSEQQGVVDKWKKRCQYKLEELAVCNAFHVLNATGGPTATAQCPFTLSIISSLSRSYAVTPGCLLVIWNTPGKSQDGIYDPCICVPCVKTPNIDVPAQLTSLCKLESFQTIVAKDVIPGESSAGVSLGSGSFRTLMDKPGFLQINTPNIAHWAVHTAIRDADLVLDWWPEEWRHPVGHHVTPGCSRPNDAHWRTFDASWRWDSTAEQLHLARDETNDPMQARTAFGAAGVCRTNNYGMPITTLNTMTVCTKENANAHADPMVESQPSLADPWVDGKENCASDHHTTPWDMDPTINPPRQWTVGTLHPPSDNARMKPLSASEWGSGCGPYPLRTCRITGDCASGLTCLRSSTKNYGVCGNMQEHRFECTAHAQCSEDRMCAGDGVCVDGVWHIRNDMPEPVAFRTYSQECSTGTALDTWGTSVAEIVPDILNASGLCSYRSWFENRRMAQRNGCTETDTCAGFSGLQQWNFTSPKRKKTVGESTFDSQVLKVKAHVCDRDYQFMEGFVSCTPNANYIRMYQGDNNDRPAPDGTSFPLDTRTRTYRPGEWKILPLIHHMENNAGPTFGFTGIPRTYAQLGMGKTNPDIKPCSSLRTCGFQPSFRVNGHPIAQRMVLDNGAPRGYLMADLLQCGVFGYQSSGENGMCRIDFAVAPLAGMILVQQSHLLDTIEYSSIAELKEAYPPDNLAKVRGLLDKIPDLILTHFVGGRPTSLQDYVTKSAIFAGMYGALGSIDKPQYTESNAGVPRQIYKLTQFGAYEVPFVWWYKCAWIGGFQISSDSPISTSQCAWRGEGSASQPTAFGVYDNSIVELLGLEKVPVSSSKNTTLLTLLMRLPGVVTQTIIDTAKTDYIAKRNYWVDRITGILSGVRRMCFQRKEFIPEFRQASERYQAQILAQIYNVGAFDLKNPYLGRDNKTEICKGDTCLRSTGYAVPTGSNLNFPEHLVRELKAAQVRTKPVYINLKLPDGDGIVLRDLFATDPLPVQFWIDMLIAFRNDSNGCTDIATIMMDSIPLTCLCSNWDYCSASVKSQVLENSKIKIIPSDTALAEIDLGAEGKVDVCEVLKNIRPGDDGVCVLNDKISLSPGVDQTTISSIKLPVGISAELYTEVQWDCVKLTCDERSPEFNNKMVPSTFTSWSSRTVQRVVIDEFEYFQLIPMYRSDSSWTSNVEEANEIACDSGNTRLQNVLEEVYIPANRGWENRPKCRPQCTVKERQVVPPNGWQFKVVKAAYYVNDTLVDEVTLFPCLNGKDWTEYTARGIISNIVSQHPYRQDFSNLDIRLCSTTTDSNALPTASMFVLAYTRDRLTRDASGMEKLKNTLYAINKVIHTINTEFVDETCATVSKSCAKTKLNTAATLVIGSIAETSSKRTNLCESLKSDSIFGCSLWPGESTVKSKESSRYACIALDEFNTFEPNRTCMLDSSADPCTSQNEGYRKSNPKGRTMVYELAITSPTCVAGPVTQCTLTDEAQTLASSSNANAGCPGTNSSSARYKAYNSLRRLRRLYTDVTKTESFSGDTVNRFSGSELAFDHIYVALNQGFACSTASPYTCPEPTQIPVQLRRRLWRCLDCPLVSNWQCIGQHGCVMQSPKLPFDRLSAIGGWDTLTAEAKAFLVDTDSDISAVVPAIVWLMAQLTTLALPSVRLSYEMTEFMTSYDRIAEYAYNPIPTLAYEDAMQRNAKTCASIGTIPDFSNCSYDGHRRNLVEFINQNYKVPDGIVIQPGDTLQWKLTRTQLTSHSIPHWNAVGDKRGMFMTDLLSDMQCRNGSMMDNACYTHSSANGSMLVEVLNPGLLGTFEPMVGCDTEIISGQRVVSSMCEDCARTPVNEYLQIEDDGEMTCPTSYQGVQGVTVDDRAETNLCTKTPTYESKCTNQQGMLSQATYDGYQTTDVYKKISAAVDGLMPIGIRYNKLFRGGSPGQGKLANLALDPDDIGGHSTRMILAGTRSGGYALDVTGMPLSSYANGLSDEAYSLSATSSDLEWIDTDMEAEADAMRILYPTPVCNAWDCPLRRRAFYMGENDAFRPLVPDPLRTQIMYGDRAHPTQKAFRMPQTLSQSTATRVLGAYVTANGFCACANAAACVSTCQSDEGALRGEWTDSSTTPSGTNAPCKEQLDWPYTGGALRDGATFLPRWTTLVECGVLDRLPVFKYRYKNLETITRSSKTTLDKGGVCHMGWPAVTAGPLEGCYLIPSTTTPPSEDSFTCPTFLQPKKVLRLKAKTIPELLSSPTRPRLSDCSPPPAYMINRTTATPPEVSYGQLKRLEASRLLANDLRRRLCGNATVCKPASTWNLESFWAGVYSKNAFNSVPTGNGENKSLWDEPWVACTQKDGVQTCDGKISRQDWVTGDRQRICLDTLTNSPLASSLAQDVNVCDLDEGMDRFCRTVQDARYQIFEANCLFSGQCRQRLFFYQPSTYAVDNGEFVRSTVQRFYNSTVAGACVPDQDTAQAILNNAPNLEKCAAVQLNVLADCIQIIRVIIGALVELVYYMTQLMLTVFKLMGAGKGAQEDAINAELNALLKLMQNKFKLLFEQIGDLIYKVIFEGPMGEWLISMITAICNFLGWLFSEVLYVVMCWVQKSTVWFLNNIANPFVDVLNGISFGALNYLHGDIANAVTAVENNIPCTQQKMWSCNLNFNSSDKRVTILPLPTRCWAGVEPGVSSLACTAADTCMTSDFGKVICGACPSPSTSSMIRFGCDTLTKLCTCSVFPSDVTACSSHGECAMEGGDMGCRYVDSYLQPSYGSVPCAQCQNPMCLITDGSGVGKCSCLLRPVPNQACSEPGQAVSPNAAQLCLAAVSGSGSLGATNAYTQNYRSLTNVPCMLLNQAQSFCMQVFTSATTAVPLVVGLALLHTGGRRRRLLWEEMVGEGLVQLDPNASTWEGRGEPCRSLILANTSQMSILDKYARGECWRWYDIGMHLTMEANMTGVNPFFLVSWHDMISTMLDRGALIEILAKLPSVIHRILLHSEALQPAYIVFTYWTAVLPPNVWVNQSLLDDAKRFLNNYTDNPTQAPQFIESHAPAMAVSNASEMDNSTVPAQRPHTLRRLLSDEEAIGIPSRRAASNVIKPATSSQTVYEWSQGPYSWPPNYVYWKGEKSCAMVSTALNVIRNGLDSTIRFYQDPVPSPLPVAWPMLPINKNISITLPSFPKNLDLGSLTIKQLTEAAEQVLSNLTEQLLDKDKISSIMIDAPYMQTIKGLIQCNFTRIQTCEGRHSLFWSVIQSLTIVLLLGILGKVLEIPYIDALLVVAFIPLFMYITYGYSLTCSPLIPTCLLRDMFDIITYLLPVELDWPEEIVDFHGCRSAACMRSCVSDMTVGFGAWQDHLAWIMCEVDEGWSVSQALTFPSSDPFRIAILRKCTVQTESMRSAQRICFAITLVRSMPFILLILLALWLIPTAGALGLAAGQFVVNILFTFVLYVHSDG